MHVLCLCLVLALPQDSIVTQHPPGDPGPLEYVPSSAGLAVPALEGGSTEFEIADVNGDGHVDVLSIGDHGSPFVNTQEHGVMTWFGDGRGNWSVSQTGNFGYGGIAIGDVNGDGLADVAYGMHHNYASGDFGDQLLEVALGDGSGTSWEPWDDGLATNGETWGMFATDLADVNGDGLLDVGSNSFGCCAGVHVYLNQGDGTWVQSFGFLGGNANALFEFGDFNGDGYPDFAAANDQGNVWLGDGLGGFVNVDGNLPGTALGRAGFGLGDVDRDGRDDYAFVRGAGQVEVWGLTGSSTWAPVGTGLPETSFVRRVRVADMNADGKPDLVGAGGGRVAIWRGDGAGGFTRALTFSLPGNGTVEVLRVGADFDHNGRPDVLLMQDESCGLFCSRNKLYAFREASAPRRLEAQLTRPLGGEVWRQGSVRSVRWLAGVPDGQSASVRVELSVSGQGGPWTVLASGLANDGEESFVVPAVTTTDAWVRVVVRAGREGVVSRNRRALSILP